MKNKHMESKFLIGFCIIAQLLFILFMDHQTKAIRTILRDVDKYSKVACGSILDRSKQEGALILYYKGEELIYEEKYDEALKLFNEALDVCPDVGKVHLMRGFVYQKKGRVKEAENEYKIALSLPMDKKYIMKTYSRLGSLYLDKGLYEEAIGIYTKVINMNPNDALSYYNRAIGYERNNDFEKATLDYNKAITISPNYDKPYNNLGVMAYKKGDKEKAMYYYDRALSLNPNSPESYNNIGVIHYNDKHFNKAIGYYNRALELKPNYAAAYKNRADLYLYLGRLDTAMDDYKRAIVFDPRYIEAYHSRAIIYFKLKKYKEAWQDIEKMKELGGKPNEKFLQDLKEASLANQ